MPRQVSTLGRPEVKTNRADCCEDCNDRHSVTANLLSSQARRETYEGREHLVVPVVMLRSDVVMNEAFVPQEEIVPMAWNGRPVMLDHSYGPRGDPISSNSPQIHERQRVGQIFNALVDGPSLKAEAWIDIEKASVVDSEIVSRLEAGEQIDVSTGYLSRDIPDSGHLNGRSYSQVSRNILPDHLALLPHATGACSWADGCGVRANQDQTDVRETVRLLAKKLGMDVGSEEDPKILEKLKMNELSYDAISSGLQRQLDAMDGPTGVHYLVAVFDDHFIYCVHPGPQSGSGAERKMYRRSYSVAESDGSIMMDDDVAEVVQETLYREVNNEGVAVMTETKTADPGSEKSGTDNKTEPQESAPVQAPESSEQIEAVVSNAVDKALAEAIPKVVDKISANLLSEDDRTALAAAKKSAEDQRTSLVHNIVANSAMTEEQLQEMTLAQLQSVSNGILPQANYGLRSMGSPIVGNGGEEDEEATGMFQTNVRELPKKEGAA